MTVQELIDVLSTFPRDLRVAFLAIDNDKDCVVPCGKIEIDHFSEERFLDAPIELTIKDELGCDSVGISVVLDFTPHVALASQ